MRNSKWSTTELFLGLTLKRLGDRGGREGRGGGSGGVWGLISPQPLSSTLCAFSKPYFLKRGWSPAFLSDCNGIGTHNHLVCKRTINHLATPTILVECSCYELSGCGFKSRCSHLNVRYGACFEQDISWYSATVKCRFTLKLVRYMIITYSPVFLWF